MGGEQQAQALHFLKAELESHLFSGKAKQPSLQSQRLGGEQLRINSNRFRASLARSHRGWGRVRDKPRSNAGNLLRPVAFLGPRQLGDLRQRGANARMVFGLQQGQ